MARTPVRRESTVQRRGVDWKTQPYRSPISRNPGRHNKQRGRHHDLRGGRNEQRGTQRGKRTLFRGRPGYAYLQQERHMYRAHPQKLIDELETLQKEDPTEIVSKLNGKQDIAKYIEASYEHGNVSRTFIRLLDKAFTCTATPALVLNILNKLKENEFVRKSLDQLKASFENFETDEESVINATASIIRILIWTTQKNPSAVLFLHGSSAILSNYMEYLLETVKLKTDNSECDTFEDTCLERDNSAENNETTMTRTDSKNAAITHYPLISKSQCRNDLDDKQCQEHDNSTDALVINQSEMETSQIWETTNDIGKCDGNDQTTADQVNMMATTANPSLFTETAFDSSSSEEGEITNARNYVKEKIDKLKVSGENWSWISGCSPQRATLLKSTMQLKSLYGEFKEGLKTYQRKTCQDNEADDLNEFRGIPIFPRLGDINGTIKPKLRAIKAKGAYKNISDYLDIQFRLLREDYMSPLRDAIQAHTGQLSGKDKKKIRDIKLYENVRIISPVFMDGIKHVIKFDVSKFGNVRWNMSKRLKYGSLVCLSADNFQTCYFATISNSDVHYKRKGILHVQFQHNNTVVNKLMDNNFTMVESSAYFEAYRHVLECLQKMTDFDFPLTKYIVENVTEVQPPNYLRNGFVSFSDTLQLYNFLCNDKHDRDDEMETLDHEIHSPDSDSVNSLQMLEDDAEQSSFDSSQLAAFNAALSNEIALIQGPPGCGKTYVGLQIVKTLLHNKFKWQPGFFYEAQLLVICYTNHALDQFLEGICHFYEDKGTIIRVGARTASKVIERYSLSNVRKKYLLSNKFPPHIRALRRDVNVNIKENEKKQNLLAMKVRILKENIANGSSLSDFMGDIFKQFCWEKRKIIKPKPWLAYLGNDIMTEWLGLHKIAQDISDDKFHRTEDYQYLDHLTDDNINLGNREAISGKIFDYEKEKNMNKSEQVKQFRKQNLAVDLDAITEDLSYINSRKKEIVKIERERLKKFIRQKLCSTTVLSDDVDNTAVVNVFSERFSEESRWRLYRTWVDRKCKMLIEEQSNLFEELENAYKSKQEMKALENSHILKEADVIGITTTGAAKFNTTLMQLNPAIVIVEEAAEVLESHLVSSLTSRCQHLILIGDHKQLKPKPEVYKLEINYNLNLSLFERLINNGIKCHTLQVQHRMRPEIADNIRYIYDDLRDHESVTNFDNILGIKYNTFFIQHSIFESKTEELKSFVNEHEALYIVYLCKYLLLQGYAEDKITILTTYKGQMFHIKKEMLKLKGGLENVLVAVVDNYQGEENDIVLISFVRSNSEARVGFLSIDNRACVALSRAKKGLFAIGNFEQLSNASSLWKSIIQNMKAKGLYGTELPLICRNHDKDEGILAKSHVDFTKAPEGGCMKPCDIRLDCGHVCNRRCHVTDVMHETTICNKPCTKECVNGHPCEMLCSQECFCTKSVTRKLPCGHEATITCSEEPSLIYYKCQETCRKELSCGHQCSQKCCDPCICTMLITKKLIKCGHEVEMLCCVDPEKFKCSHKCEKMLPCGHRCSRLCRDKCSPCKHSKKLLRADCGHECIVKCGEDITNTPCSKTCNLPMRCGHKCKDICGENNELTTRKFCPNGHMYDCKASCNFTLSCGHKCKDLCYQCAKNNSHMPCRENSDVDFICGHKLSIVCCEIAPCYKWCMRKCKHQRCHKGCSDICKPCSKPCAWKCKHYKCSKPCGEMCDRPRCFESCDKVLVCGHLCYGLCGDPCPLVCFRCDELCGTYDESIKYVQLQDCGHIFPADLMDEFMDVDDGLCKRCPDCNTAIVTANGNRYEKVVNQHWKNLNDLKIKSKEYIALAQNACNSLNIKLNNDQPPGNMSIECINKEAVLWCAEEIRRRHSLGNCEPNLSTYFHTNSIQGMCDLENQLRLDIDIWTLQHLENLPNLTMPSIELIAEGWDVIRKCGTYLNDDQDALRYILSRVREQNSLKTGSILVNVVMNDCLPYMSIQEDVILDKQTDIEFHNGDSKKLTSQRKTSFDGHGNECSPENDYSYLAVNACLDIVEDIQVEVEQAVHFLVNEVCQSENRTCKMMEEKLFEQEITHVSKNEILHQTPSELEQERHEEMKSPELNKSTLLTTRVTSEIPIIDQIRMKNDGMDSLSLDETTAIKPHVDSAVYTIHLMAFPWTKYRSEQSILDKDYKTCHDDSTEVDLDKETDQSTCTSSRNPEQSTSSGPASPEQIFKTEDSRHVNIETLIEMDSCEYRKSNNDCHRKRRFSEDGNHVRSSTESPGRHDGSQRNRHVENSSAGRQDRKNKERNDNSNRHHKDCSERRRHKNRQQERSHDGSHMHHGHRQENVDRYNRSHNGRGPEEVDRYDRSHRSHRPEEVDRYDRSHHGRRPEEVDRYDRSHRSHRPEEVDRYDRSHRSHRPEEVDRYDRSHHGRNKKKHDRRYHEHESRNEVRHTNLEDIGRGASAYRETNASHRSYEEYNARTCHEGDYRRSGTKRKSSDEMYFSNKKRR